LELSLGTETSGDYYSFELSHTGYKLVGEMKPIQNGQQVLIIADRTADMGVVRATSGVVNVVGEVPTVLIYHSLPEPMQEPPRQVTGSASTVQVWFDLAVFNQL